MHRWRASHNYCVKANFSLKIFAAVPVILRDTRTLLSHLLFYTHILTFSSGPLWTFAAGLNAADYFT